MIFVHQWPDVSRVVIYHRIGRLSVGEISVLWLWVVLIEVRLLPLVSMLLIHLKHNAPIWKKEHWQDGSSSWVSIGACEQES